MHRVFVPARVFGVAVGLHEGVHAQPRLALPLATVLRVPGADVTQARGALAVHLPGIARCL